MPRTLSTIDQPATGQSQQDEQALDLALRRLKVGEQLPARMGMRDMCRAFGIKPSTFYLWLHKQQFDRFEIKPRVGSRAWSGARVKAFLDGRG